MNTAIAERSCPVFDAKSFRESMSRVPAAVHIVTAAEGMERVGVTATAMCSVSDSPCSLLICLYREGRARALMREGTAVAVNTLQGSQQELAAVFAGQGRLPMADRFNHGDWDLAPGKAPTLNDALVTFQCKVDSIMEYGSHSVIICRALEVLRRESESALLYGARQYARLHFQPSMQMA